MKRVAFLSFDWDYKIVCEYYLGLQERLRNRTDVQVVIFNAFGRYYASHAPKENTFEVFSLYNANDYDGLLIQGNRTWPPELRQKLVDEAVALGKPVVSINYDLRGAHSVGTNNYKEEYELVRQVLRDRGCKRPAFVNGLKTSVEAQDRARAYCDACIELGITDPGFYQANWQLSAGVVVAKRLLRRPKDLPDVIFCCNDDLAVGIWQTFESAGVRVPDDVMLAGFDNREIGQRMSPTLTTVDRDYRTIAKTALDMLVRIMGGDNVDSRAFSPARHVLTRSCGYLEQFSSSQTSTAVEYGSAAEHFFEEFNSFQSAVHDDESLYSMMENCEMFARNLDCENAFLVLNDDYLRSNAMQVVETYGSQSVLTACKKRSRQLRCDVEHHYASFNTRDILPPELLLTGSIYTVSPLHHRNACIGTFVTEGVPNAMRLGLAAYYLTALSSAIDAVRNSELLREATEELERLRS